MTKFQKAFMYYGMYRSAVFVNNVAREVVRQFRARQMEETLVKMREES